MSAPEPDEYAPFYAGYVEAVVDADLPALLESQPVDLAALCDPLTDDQALFRYSAGKWSIKEVLGHLADAERVFSYRALRVSRGDPTPLAGFDENAYVAASRSDLRPVSELLEEIRTVRDSTLILLGGVQPDAWPNRGMVNGSEVSLRALVFIIAGHMQHHRSILANRYGLTPSIEPSP